MSQETGIVCLDDMLENAELVVKSMGVAYPLCVANGTLQQEDADWELKVQRTLVHFLLDQIERAEED